MASAICRPALGCLCSTATTSACDQFDSSKVFLDCLGNSKYLNLRPFDFDASVLS